ncbi:MAG: hypothetical protein KatS3mg111_3874 [Pirellulaceae bacterium]|nr:MAG: hypothetical protein KatS3mg111_3874 [Pirellulaceae bacterium]
MVVWPYLWIAFMLGLVIATIVVAIRERKARAVARAAYASPAAEEPMALPAEETPFEPVEEEPL